MKTGLSATLAPSFGDRWSMAWADLAWADLAVLAIIGLSAVLSLFRGFVREAIALAGWIAGLWLAFRFGEVAAGWFGRWIESPDIRSVLGFAAVLAAALVVAGVAGRLAGGLVHVTGMGGTDRVLGMIFGAGRGAVIVAVLALLAGFTGMKGESWWGESVLLPRFEAVAAELGRLLPDGIARSLPRSLPESLPDSLPGSLPRSLPQTLSR